MTTVAEPPKYRDIPEEDRLKAKVFFDRGNAVAGTGNYEYAIEMYISGLAIDPENVEAHQTLRELSLKRKASGGKDTFKGNSGDDSFLINNPANHPAGAH